MLSKLNKLSKSLRMWQWVSLGIIFSTTLYFVAPQQLGLLLLKATYITIAIAIGYWADRIIFYYARPHKMEAEAWREVIGHTVKDERIESAYRAYSLAMLRRAIVVGAVVLAFCLGL